MLRFVVSHPFRRKNRKGWGTEHLFYFSLNPAVWRWLSLSLVDRDVIFNPNMMRRFSLPSAALVLYSVVAPAQQKDAPAVTQAVLA